jgi:mRNA interferase YafQ
MYKIIYSKKFKRNYKKFIKRFPYLTKQIENSIKSLGNNPFSNLTHKLSGELFELYACKCGYDCRIIFSIENIKNENIILIVDIGTHNEVY